MGWNQASSRYFYKAGNKSLIQNKYIHGFLAYFLNNTRAWNIPSLSLSFFISHLYSRIMLFSGAKPIQALSIFSSMALCFERAFTTGVPGGTCHANIYMLGGATHHNYKVLERVESGAQTNKLSWSTQSDSEDIYTVNLCKI